MKFYVANILDEIEDGGVEQLQADLSTFSSPQNPEIEDFIHHKAIDFATGKLSITYLVNNAETGDILGFFTLTHKSIIVNGNNLSSTSRKKLIRYSRMDTSSGNYMASAFLLAQLGKNYSIKEEQRIDGADLMKLATEVLVHIQHQIGGGIVYLDCEDNDHLVRFYSSHNFKCFDNRISVEDDQRFIQFIRFF